MWVLEGVYDWRGQGHDLSVDLTFADDYRHDHRTLEQPMKQRTPWIHITMKVPKLITCIT